MKKCFLTIATALLTFITANAEEKTKVYEFGDITGIEAGYNYQVRVTEGKSHKVKIVYNDDILDKLDIRYSSFDKTLRLHVDNTHQRKVRNRASEPVLVYIEMDDISSIDLSGASEIRFTGNYKAGHLKIDLSGASELHSLNVKGESIKVDCSGASTAEITGYFPGKADIGLSGASEMKFEGGSKMIAVEASGACELECIGNFETSKISCSGACEVNISGKGTEARYECSGASEIDGHHFVVKELYVELSGASEAEVNATERISHDVSRGSKLTYYGEAKLYDMNGNTNIIKGR